MCHICSMDALEVKGVRELVRSALRNRFCGFTTAQETLVSGATGDTLNSCRGRQTQRNEKKEVFEVTYFGAFSAMSDRQFVLKRGHPISGECAFHVYSQVVKSYRPTPDMASETASTRCAPCHTMRIQGQGSHEAGIHLLYRAYNKPRNLEAERF